MKLTNIMSKVLVTSGIHGNESRSNEALLAIKKQYPQFTYRPNINPTSDRIYDGIDMNRAFPDGNEVVKEIAELIEIHDIIIDIHCAGRCKPFVLVDPGKHSKKISDWARRGMLPVVMEGDVFEDDNLDKSLSGYAASIGKIAITIEIDSENSSYDHILADSVYHMVYGSLPVVNSVYKRENIETDSEPGKTITWLKLPGDFCAQSDVVCMIGDNNVVARRHGMILAINYNNIVPEDGHIGMIGYE